MSQILGDPIHDRGLVCKIYKKMNRQHMEKVSNTIYREWNETLLRRNTKSQ